MNSLAGTSPVSCSSPDCPDSEIVNFQDEHWLTENDWLTISQTVEVLKPFKRYTEMLSSDTANLSLVIPMIHMASFLAQATGCADWVLAAHVLVRRLQDELEIHFGLSKTRGYTCW